MKSRKKWTRSDRRKVRHLIIRRKIIGTEKRPRLCIFFSLRWTTCQVINDSIHKTIIGASVRGKNIKCTKALATKICEKISANDEVDNYFYFDRSGYRFCEKVKAFVDQCAKEGIKL